MGEDETIDFESSLDLMGFRLGFMDVRLYSEQHNYDKKLADIIRPSLPKCGGTYSGCVYKVPDITLHMIRHALYMGPGPVNFFVIAKPQRELFRVLQCLKLRRHNVLLVKPPPPDEECLFSVDSLLNTARLLGGGKPRYNPLQRYTDEFDSSLEKYIEIKEDLSKTVDFSERIPTVKGPRTAVFWDAVDCPFPPSSTPDEIYHSISSALVEREFSDNITIWAYLDDDDKKGSALLGDRTWASRIYFLPGGDKASRRIRMLNDINLWMRDSPQMSTSYEASLVLFSDQFKDDDVYYRDMLQRLGNMRYYVLLVTPALDINKPETPEWPGLLIDRGAYFFDEVKIQIYQGPDAAAAEEETPPIMSDMDYSLLSPFGDQTSDSSEDEGSPFWPPRTDDMLDGGQSSAEKETPVYRWDPFTLMYKLESLFPKEHEAVTAAEEETPKKLATHGICRLDPTSFEWPGRQIDGGLGCESYEEPCPKKHKAEENA
ncbi:hypothetical protein Bca52824_050424 [Brassica carinata]|uniref:NYN domain-containing protein n=1 Tax=Brassica carinata TaxID=52824 RepID=A0A8X7R617_BRACI|nr:hypothetical protein Bca52824_050424 [Brassica carinata]